MAFVFFTACKKDPSAIGLNYVENETDFGTLEQTPLVTYSTTFDSVRSNNPLSGIGLVGGYSDPVFGRHDAQIATHIMPGGTSPDFGSNPICDSAFLYLPYTLTASSWYGDTTAPFRLLINVLNEYLDRSEDYYSNNVFPAGALIADYTFTPEPGSDHDTSETKRPMLRIPLDNNFINNTIFPLAQSGSMSSIETFIEDFNGLLISGDPANEAILGFHIPNEASVLRIHYQNDTTTTSNPQYDLRITDKAVFVNTFQHDYSTAEFDLSTQDTVLGEASFYSQAMSGVVGVVDIPHLSAYQDSGWLLNRAELSLKVRDLSADNYRLPNAMQVVLDDPEGRRIAFDYISEGQIAVGGTVQTDDQNNSSYTFVLTRQIQRFIDGEDHVTRMLIVPDLSSSDQSRAVFNGHTSAVGNAVLKLYYTRTN